MSEVISPPVSRIVARLPGSLPMGGAVADTPIHAFVTPPAGLPVAQPSQQVCTRTDLPLGHAIAFRINDVVTAVEADAIVEASERLGYREEAPGISTPPGMRMNKTVHWLAPQPMMAALFGRIGHLLPDHIEGVLNPDFSQRINMYRYDDGDVFNRHTDGDWPGYGLDRDGIRMVEWPGLRSRLTMLLYLNGQDDGVEGGDTRLYRPDGTWIEVRPRKGSALFFRHGFGADSVVHEGRRVTGRVPKYVARINVLYRELV
jgi:hypothetical protein